MAKEIIVGIDLGTTNSVISCMQADGKVKVIPNPEGTNTTPSVVAFNADGEEIVGNAAKRQAITNPDTVSSAKRHIGTSDKFHINCLNKDFTPQEISSKVLAYMKGYAEKNLGQPVKKAVITVPAYFNDAQRQATKDAGTIAGLDVVRIINEPTAAALTYAWHRGELGRTDATKTRRILIYDLGGGTFDSTVVEYTGNNFHVVSTDGDVKLGGVDWNDRLADYVCQKFQEKHGVNLHQFPKTMQILRNDCDVAKIQLTTREQTSISVRHEGLSISVPVTRDLFEELTYDLLQRTADTTEYVIQQANMKFSDLDAIVMIGGSTLMPQVAKMLERVTGLVPYRSDDLDPHTAVARGAAIHAAILEAQYNGGGNLDERVKKLLENVHEEDVNSHGLGVVATDPNTKQVVNYIMIPRNTTLPFSVTKTFKTQKDGQNRISVQVMEGDAPDPTACSFLGKCRIVGLPENLPKGSLVEVTYAFDKTGRISVSAREKKTNTQAKIEIERRGVLTEEELQNFIRLADQYTIE